MKTKKKKGYIFPLNYQLFNFPEIRTKQDRQFFFTSWTIQLPPHIGMTSNDTRKKPPLVILPMDQTDQSRPMYLSPPPTNIKAQLTDNVSRITLKTLC